MHPSPGNPKASLWASCRSHRSLLWQFTARNIHLRHKGSALGLLWTVLQPLIMLGMYTLIFGLIMGGRFRVRPDETGIDFALGVFLGLTIYNLLADNLTQSPWVVVSTANLVKKAVFPLEVLPLSNVGASLFNFTISVLLCAVAIAVWGPPLTLSCLWIPVILLPVMLAAVGLSLALSALGVFLRDLSQVMGFVAMALFYASGIFFSAGTVMERAPEAWQFLRFNPVLHAIEMSRHALLWNTPVDPLSVAYLYLCALALLLFGWWSFRRLKSGFADVL